MQFSEYNEFYMINGIWWMQCDEFSVTKAKWMQCDALNVTNTMNTLNSIWWMGTMINAMWWIWCNTMWRMQCDENNLINAMCWMHCAEYDAMIAN